MKIKFKLFLLLFAFSFLIYTFFQFPGFQGYEDETYNRIVNNLATGEFKTSRSGYAQTLLETPFVFKGQVVDKIFGNNHGRAAQLYALFYNPFVTAVSVAVIFLIFSLYASEKKSFLLSLLYAFGTMAFPYASIGMEPTAVLLVLLSVYFLFKFGECGNMACHVPANVYLLAAGFFYFGLSFSKAYYFVTIPAYIAYLYLLCGRALNLKLSRITNFIKYCSYFFAPLIIILPAYLLANKYNFGVYFGGQYKLSDELFGGENILFGVYGLLLGFGKSIFIYVPALILSIILFPKFYGKKPKEAVFVLAYSALLILFVSQIHWWSDETWGPRYLLSLSAVGLLPLVALKKEDFISVVAPVKAGIQKKVISWIPDQIGNDKKRIGIGNLVISLILAFSFLFQLLGALVRYDVFPYTFYEIYEKTGYNVLASQEYQYIPQFAPYRVNYQVLKNKILGRDDFIKYKIIYTPPMEMASQKREGGIIKEIVYDNTKYKNHALNFWWMNVPEIAAYKLLGIFVLIFAGLIWWGKGLLIFSLNHR